MSEQKNIQLADIQQDKKLKDLLEFPCAFPFKVVGAKRDGFMDEVVCEVQKIIKGDYNPTLKESAKGTYHSVSITIQAENIEQIEILYANLAQIEGVRMVL